MKWYEQPISLYESSDLSGWEHAFTRAGDVVKLMQGEDISVKLTTRGGWHEKKWAGADVIAQTRDYRAKLAELDRLAPVDRAEREEVVRGFKSRSIPACTPSGRFPRKRSTFGGNRLEAEPWSRLVALDLDHVTDAPAERERLRGDRQVACAAVSVGGAGVWCAYLIDRDPFSPTEWARIVRFVAYEVFSGDPAKVDEVCKDTARLRYIGHDPEAWGVDEPVPVALPSVDELRRTDETRVRRMTAAAGREQRVKTKRDTRRVQEDASDWYRRRKAERAAGRAAE